MTRSRVRPGLWLAFAGSVAVYTLLLAMGPRYDLPVPVEERPLLSVLGLYFLAYAIYSVALPLAIRAPRAAGWVVGTSLVLRVLLTPTPPYQEIDIYRYLWDGAVVAEGVSPYAYPPERIVTAMEASSNRGVDDELNRLLAVARDAPALGEIVRTIHYGELTSPYPPVSQAVFAAAAKTSLRSWDAKGRLVWLKGWLTLFDMVTLLAVIDLLRTCRLPAGWALAYGWCPLVLKEIAGSGHLDSIAIGLTAWALALSARALRDPDRWGLAAGAAALLGLGVGAKLYPIVLAPLLALAFLRRAGWRVAVLGAVSFVAVAALTLAPMSIATPAPVAAPDSDAESIPPPPGVDGAGESGLSAFLTQWEMNDLLFMLVYENARWRPDDAPRATTPWFDVTPAAWSERFQGRDDRAFALTRAVTGSLFALLAVVLAWRAASRLDGSTRSLRAWLRAAFLTLAWFWLLAPTQNPWYWCWAAPLLPWVGGRAWLAMGAFTLLYYLRFWLQTHFPQPGVLGTAYDGEYFFYYVVPWLEYVPIFAWLVYERVVDRRTEPPECVGRRTDSSGPVL